MRILTMSLLLGFCVLSRLLGVESRPNILFIMSDDHAAHAVSAYGSRVIQTPQLDRLAKEGMRFDRCFAVNSICTPSRACILTGKYSHLNGVPTFNHIDPAQRTVASLLQGAGYYTAMLGKWHLGSEPVGFDRWMILPGQGVYFNPDFLTREGRTNITGYATDVITDLAIQTIQQRPKDRPFFLMCHHKAPHRSWDPDDKHAAVFRNRQIPEPGTLLDDYSTRSDAAREATMTVARDLTYRDLKIPAPAGMTAAERSRWEQTKPMEITIENDGRKQTLTGEALIKWKYQRYMQDYLACVASIDDNVGRLLDFLDREGLRDNTVVIYTSDQGFFLGDHGWYDKRFMYEESIKMPFLVRWPRGIKAGSVMDAMALNVDFASTFLQLAGAELPSDLQGRSLVPLFQGKKPADWRKSWYYRYYHDPGHHNTRAHYGVRTETHKLICFWKTGQWECYDLVKDPQEMRNVYGDPAYAKVVAELKQELFRLKKEVKDEDQFAETLPKDDVDGPLLRIPR